VERERVVYFDSGILASKGSFSRYERVLAGEGEWKEGKRDQYPLP